MGVGGKSKGQQEHLHEAQRGPTLLSRRPDSQHPARSRPTTHTDELVTGRKNVGAQMSK